MLVWERSLGFVGPKAGRGPATLGAALSSCPLPPFQFLFWGCDPWPKKWQLSFANGIDSLAYAHHGVQCLLILVSLTSSSPQPCDICKTGSVSFLVYVEV